jgi:hypothetical protein
MSAHKESPGQTGPEEKTEGRASWGIAACILGVISAATGVFFIDFVFELLGIVLGATGYALGARRLGKATVVISTVLLLVFLAASQGVIPGIDPRDPLAM